MRLLLIRHGETESNLLGALDTAAPGASLTELGRAQAAELAERLEGERIDAVFVSNLSRTQETSAGMTAARGLVPTLREGLREVSVGDLEGRHDEDARAEYLAAYRTWAAGSSESRVANGETAVEAIARFDAVVREAEQADPDQAVLFSHASVIRLWVAYRARNAPAMIAVRDLPNTGIVVLEGSSDAGWQLVSWDGSGIDILEQHPPAGAQPREGSTVADPR